MRGKKRKIYVGQKRRGLCGVKIFGRKIAGRKNGPKMPIKNNYVEKRGRGEKWGPLQKV